MSRHGIFSLTIAAVLSVSTLAACGSHISLAEPTPVSGPVTDRAAFEGFIATRPGPFEFRRIYPDVVLVLPQDMATRELRHDNSRYFARLDSEGRIVGGDFR